jgi:transposase-like protein
VVCSNELAAVEFLENTRWGECPCCVHCGSVAVFQLKDKKTGERNKRFLWKCKDCKKQYTVRIGMVCEESRIPLRHWCLAFWLMSVSKKGVSALQVMRQTGISYKSALFLVHRIRFAMAPASEQPKLSGVVECDETCVGGKPRLGTGPHKRGLGTVKTPVFIMVERGGNIRRQIMPNVTAKNVKAAIREMVSKNAEIHTDENRVYQGLGNEFAGHGTVCHRAYEYSREGVHNNTAESSNALLKRGLMGVYHAVSKQHLHRYVAEFDFRWNARKMNDGERTELAIRSADGKRLMYRETERGAA